MKKTVLTIKCDPKKCDCCPFNDANDECTAHPHMIKSEEKKYHDELKKSDRLN